MAAFVPAGLDLESAVARLVVQALIDHGRPSLSHLSTNAPVSPGVRRNHEYKIAAWVRWTGLSEADLIALPHETRCELVEAFLAVESETKADQMIKKYRTIFNWWARENHLDSPVTPVAKAIKGRGKGIGKSAVLTGEQITALLAGLKSCAVASDYSDRDAADDRFVGWHLRTRAALLITLTSSLRAQSELPQMTDDTILRVDDDGIVVRLPLTKNRRHRDIVIRPRSDELCPLTALTDWFAWLDQHGLDRPGGALLPAVNRQLRLDNPAFLQPSGREQDSWWTPCRNYLTGLGYDMTGVRLHGLRSSAITEAVAAGWSHTRLRDLGGWGSLNVAASYARTGDPGIDLYERRD